MHLAQEIEKNQLHQLFFSLQIYCISYVSTTEFSVYLNLMKQEKRLNIGMDPVETTLDQDID